MTSPMISQYTFIKGMLAELGVEKSPATAPTHYPGLTGGFPRVGEGLPGRRFGPKAQPAAACVTPPQATLRAR
jgi:hypothetical protein